MGELASEDSKGQEAEGSSGVDSASAVLYDAVHK